MAHLLPDLDASGHTVRLTLIALISITCHAKNEEFSNEIISPPPIKLDDNLRRALLKALTELENEAREKDQRESKALKQSSISQDASDAFFQKAPASSLSIFTKTEDLPSPNVSSTTEQTSAKPLIVVQKSEGEEPRVISSFSVSSSVSSKPLSRTKGGLTSAFGQDAVLTSASNSFVSTPTKHRKKGSTTKPTARAELIDITTPTPILTSSTEESEAKVEDIQFFSAPLVAAFTVHHDALGLPKSVEPILRPQEPRPIQQQPQRVQEDRTRQSIYEHEQFKQTQYLRQQEQLQLQRDLLEKQRVLEQQLVVLQHQQKRQQDLLRIRQLQDEQRLRQQQAEQRLRNQQDDQRLRQQQSSTPASNEFGAKLVQAPVRQNVASSVSFQPSIQFNPAPQTSNNFAAPPTASSFIAPASSNSFVAPPTASSFIAPPSSNSFVAPPTSNNFVIAPSKQQPPVRNAVDFNAKPSQIILPPHLPFHQLPSAQQQQPALSPIQNTNSFEIRPSIESNRVFRHESGTGNFFNQGFAPSSISEGTRVFRHESGTANFVNPDLSNFNTGFNALPPRNYNRFFRSNAESLNTSPGVQQSFQQPINYNSLQQTVPSSHYKNLIYHSGVGRGQSSEDLNIVSKVLALNHFGATDYFGRPVLAQAPSIRPGFNNNFVF